MFYIVTIDGIITANMLNNTKAQCVAIAENIGIIILTQFGKAPGDVVTLIILNGEQPVTITGNNVNIRVFTDKEKAEMHYRELLATRAFVNACKKVKEN